MNINIDRKFNRLIWSSLGEIQGGYFAKKSIREELGINKEKLEEFFCSINKSDAVNSGISLVFNDLDLIIRCIEVTIRELGVEEFFTITGINFECEALPLLNELKAILEKERKTS